jgi:hypothetical protein
VSILCVTHMYPSPQRPGHGAFVYQQGEQLRRQEATRSKPR